MGGGQRQFGFLFWKFIRFGTLTRPCVNLKAATPQKMKISPVPQMILTIIFFSYRSQNSGELFPKGPASNSIILKKVTFFQGIRQSEPRDPRSSKVYKVIRIQLQQSKERKGGGYGVWDLQSSWSGCSDFSCLLLLCMIRKGGYWLNVLWHKHKLKNRKKTKKNKGAGASEAHSQTQAGILPAIWKTIDIHVVKLL